MMESRAPLSPEQTEQLVGMYFSKNKGQYIGPFILGAVLDLVMAGIVINQFVEYHTKRGKQDQKFTKTVAYTTSLLSIASSIMTIVYMMRIFVYNWGLYYPMAAPHWPAIFSVINCIICTLTQIVYVARGYRLLQISHRFPVHKLFLAAMILMMLVELGTGVASIIYTNTTFKNLLDIYKAKPLLYATLITSMVGDLILTLSTSYALYKSKTGWAHTDSVIHRLMGFMFQTQSPPTIIAIIVLVYFSQYGATTVVIAFDMCMNKPYVIGLLAVLNARDTLRKKMYSQFTGNTLPKNISLSRGNESQNTKYSEIKVPEITIEMSFGDSVAEELNMSKKQ